MIKKIAILGSTGSIGKTLINIIKQDKKNFEIVLLSADENYKELIASKSKLTLIKFTADWCGPCKAINPILETISEKMADKIVIANHDVDSQPNFATANAIRSIPTLFLYKDGSHVDTLVGGTDQTNIEAFINKHL